MKQDWNLKYWAEFWANITFNKHFYDKLWGNLGYFLFGYAIFEVFSRLMLQMERVTGINDVVYVIYMSLMSCGLGLGAYNLLAMLFYIQKKLKQDFNVTKNI